MVNEPKKYKAKAILDDDPFVSNRDMSVEGYYVKHITATPNPINTPEGHKKFLDEHTKHYIITDGFSDWNLPREMKQYEIDITTLEEL